MAAETLTPDGVLDATNYSALPLSSIQEDPSSDDGLWGTWSSPGDTSARVSFPSPTGNPTTGAGLQTFRVRLRKTAAAGNATTWSLELFENGVSVAVLATGTTTATDPGEVVSGTWDASLLSGASGADVECRLLQTSGGTGAPPGDRRGIEVGAFAWDVEYTPAPTEAADLTWFMPEGDIAE